MLPYAVLDRKRLGEELSEAEVYSIVQGALSGAWSDSQLSAFLMAAAVRGLSEQETQHLTMAMLESGSQWDLAREIPGLVDKHSTGGVGDKISLVLCPILAACGVPIAMLTGRALGHTAGTADKLESIPGLDLGMDRQRCLSLVRERGMAIGIATAEIAPADRHLYRLRDQTATVESVPLIVASILSKKLASGAGAVVFDVKTGNGAFMSQPRDASALADRLVRVARSMGREASALVTDMSQPLGNWVGHVAEVRESLECLAGDGGKEVLEISLALGEELLRLTNASPTRADLEEAVASGAARQVFEEWAAAQGAEANWQESENFRLAPYEVVLEATDSGVLRRVDTRRLGLLLVEAGAGRRCPEDVIDFAVSMRYSVRLGWSVEPGQELGRLYLRQRDEALETYFLECFEVGEHSEVPELVRERIDP